MECIKTVMILKYLPNLVTITTVHSYTCKCDITKMMVDNVHTWHADEYIMIMYILISSNTKLLCCRGIKMQMIETEMVRLLHFLFKIEVGITA